MVRESSDSKVAGRSGKSWSVGTTTTSSTKGAAVSSISSSPVSVDPSKKNKKLSSRSPEMVGSSIGTVHLKAPTELGQEETNTKRSPPALRHVRSHPRIVETRRRAKAAVRRRMTWASMTEEREIYQELSGSNPQTTFSTSFVYAGMEVLVVTTQRAAFLLCARTRFILQSLRISNHLDVKLDSHQQSHQDFQQEYTIVSLRAHPASGQIVIVTDHGLLFSFAPKPAQPTHHNFGKFVWTLGSTADCCRIFDAEKLVQPLFAKHALLQVSLADNFFILLAFRDQLVVLDANPDNNAHAEMLWTKCLHSPILAAALSGDAHSIAAVLQPNIRDLDAPHSNGVHTFERDWDDGGVSVVGSNSQETHSTAQNSNDGTHSYAGTEKKNSSPVGIMYKPGPFLVHSAPVTRLSFRGKGRETSHPPHNFDLDETPGNDLLLTVSEDNTAQIFGQSNWKPLTEWTMAPNTIVSWVTGTAALTLGDLEGKSSSSTRKKGTSSSRRPSDSSISDGERGESGNEHFAQRRSQFTSIPTHTTPVSKAGAWICEVCPAEGGPLSLIRLSRLIFLKRGADDLSPTLFESICGYLPANTILHPSLLGGSVDPATISVEGFWPAWNPSMGDSTAPLDTASTNDTFSGSAMAFLGLSSVNPHAGGGAFGFVDPQLVGVQAPPFEVRLTLPHSLSGHVTVLEFPVYGDKSLTSLELGTPTHNVLALDEFAVGENNISNDQDVDLDSLDHGSGRLVAKLKRNGTVYVSWRQPGTMSVLPSSWHPDDVFLPNVTELLSNTRRLKDESLLQAPMVLRPFWMPKELDDDHLVAIFWWPDLEVVGCPPILLAFTKRGSALAFEVVTPIVAVTAETDVSWPSSSLGPPPDFTDFPAQGDQSPPRNEAPEYQVSIVPDPELGLGLRLESLDDGQPAIAGSFKKNPVTNEILPAEKTGLITLGDELISANNIPLADKTFDEIIATVRELGSASGPENPIVLRFRRQSAARMSRANSSRPESPNRRTMEQMLGVSPEDIQKSPSRNGTHEPEASYRSGASHIGYQGEASQIAAYFSNPIAGVASAVSSDEPRRKMVLLPCRNLEKTDRSSSVIVCCAKGKDLSFSLLRIPFNSRQATGESLLLHSFSPCENEIEVIQYLEYQKSSYFMLVLDVGRRARVAVVTIDLKGKSYSASWSDILILGNQNPMTVDIRAHSVRLFATLDTSFSSNDPLLIWSPKIHPGCKLNQSKSPTGEPLEKDSDYTCTGIRVEGALQTNGRKSKPIVDFGFVESSFLDPDPWLIVFDLQGLTLHHRPWGFDEWVPLTYVYYARLPSYSKMSNAEDAMFTVISRGRRPRDLFPHLLPTLHAALSSFSEDSALRCDWHPESVLSYICLDLKGADHALKGRIRDLFLWLCSEDAIIEEDQATSPLLCAPIPAVDKEERDSEENSLVNRRAPEKNILEALMMRVETDGSAKDQAKLRNLMKLLSEVSGDWAPREKLKSGADELSPMLRSMSSDDLMLLSAIGELLLHPPDYLSSDVSSQLFIFSTALTEILRKEAESNKKEKTTKFVAPSVLRKDVSRRAINSDSPGLGCVVASGACLSALTSDSQARILEWVRRNYPKMDWSTAQRMRLPFWVRSDKTLARLSEEIGQAMFREKRDVMECALFFIIARKIRTLRNLAATDQSDSGKKFFTFLSSHDFSSERGRRAAEKNAFSLLRKCRYRVAAAFFLLAEPPSLNTALETLVTKLHDLDLAFMVARLMESKEVSLAASSSASTSFGSVFGGGGGYAGSGTVITSSLPSDDGSYRQWCPSLGKSGKKLMVERLFKISADDNAMCAIHLLWMNKREEASWWLPGFITSSHTTESGFKVVDDLERRLSDKQKARAERFGSGAIDRANAIIDLASIPLLQKNMKTDTRSSYAGCLWVSNQLTSRGIEIPAMWSILFYLGDETIGRSPKSNVTKANESPSVHFPATTASGRNDSSATYQSSIFDSFEVPRVNPAPPPPPPQFSIFDAYDVPKPKPPTQKREMQPSNFGGLDVAGAKNASTGTMQSSIFDSFEIPSLSKKGSVPLGNEAKSTSRFETFGEPADQSTQSVTVLGDCAPEYEIHLSLPKVPVPDIWSCWKERTLVLCATRRLLREVAVVLASCHGDPPDVSIEDFVLQNHPILPAGASSVLQNHCIADVVLERVRKSVREFSSICEVDELEAVESAVMFLGATNQHRINFSVVLYASINRFDLAESVMRAAAHSLILGIKSFSLALDDSCDRRQTRHQVCSVQVRRLSARMSWQLETCLWLHRGGGMPLSGLAFKETTVAVRLGILLAAWHRTPSALEATLRCEPDTIVDDDEGALLWSSLKHSTPENFGEKSKKTSSGGWEFFVDCRRSEATKILKDSPTGSFIIRPHPNDSCVFTLSFKTNLVPGDEGAVLPDDAQNSILEEGVENEAHGRPPRSTAKAAKRDDVVQHAIIRLSDSGFRCGSFGPFTSLLDLLESVSESLPFELRFDLPPTNRVIREEGSQPSPNSVLFRKLTLSHASSMASRPPPDSGDLQQMFAGEAQSQTHRSSIQPTERNRSFGIFLDLLVLTKIRRQLSGMAIVQYEYSDPLERTDSTQSNARAKYDVASWIMCPLLGWCRSLEVRAVFELSPTLSSLWNMLPAQSQLMDVSEQSVEVTLRGKGALGVDSGDSILRAMIQRDSGVDFSTLRLLDGGECSMVVLFSKSEAIEWLISSGTEHSEADAIRRLERMEKERVIEPVDFSSLPLKQRPGDLGVGIRYRFVDPWEVEAVSTREGETRSASLGRQRFLGFSLGKVALACESDFRVMGGLPLLELWMSTKGGVVLSRGLAAIYPPWERGSAGDLQVRGGVLAEPEPFANSIRQHLYRNALFRRMELPQRFLALVQVELLDLKNLTSPGGSLSLSVYALLRLKRRGSSGVLSSKTRTLDTASTSSVRLGKPTGVGPNAPASWGSVVRFRYPLPDDVSIDGTSFDMDREALFKGPPSVLQITVYEKKLLVDHALGTADVDMDGLYAGGQVEEWVPLRSEKHGIHWFTRIRLTLRFELMCLASGEHKDLSSAAPSVGIQRIQTLCQTGGAAAHEDYKRSLSSPDLLQYLESIVY